jgi:hypothetical protein
MINPDAVRNQVEGNILQTLSRTLFEETTFDHAHVTSVDWASYPILRFPDVPELRIELIDRRDQPPFGAGEAASTPVPERSPTRFRRNRARSRSAIHAQAGTGRAQIRRLAPSL